MLILLITKSNNHHLQWTTENDLEKSSFMKWYVDVIVYFITSASWTAISFEENHKKMHTEMDGDSFGNQRGKFRVRGKWELILVLLVVIAGVVVTTIAVLKAKGK